ncbi:hypothetical protein [Streptomyces sp. NPDC127092]|uniref:hypothetical protein n=1 Tax=Streptomyces sp. NPDC127092 TaxID=3347135 RepID=UPI003662BF49
MSTARLSASEIVNELLSALADDGWLTTSTAPAGPGPVPADASLATIAEALRAHSRSGMLPAGSNHELVRAADSVGRAQELESAGDLGALYGELGSALAYLVQARRASIDLDSPETAS